MRIVRNSWLWLPCVVAVSAQAIHAQPPSPPRNVPLKVGNVPVADVLQRLGAKFEHGSDVKQLDAYASHFDRTDPNRDGKHTKEEYVDNGRYMTPQARAGIFRAADGNADGVVTRDEYVLNRVITDEAKTIVQAMDDNRDGVVEQAEFVKHAAKPLSDPKLAAQLFSTFDANADGRIIIPEYLRIWGKWARAGQKPAEQRIAARRAELAGDAKKPGKRAGGCPACAMGLTAEFVFKRLDANQDGKITAEEFRKSPGMQSEDQARKVVGRIDTSGDGLLAWKEFETAYRTRHADCKKVSPKRKQGAKPSESGQQPPKTPPSR